MRLTRRGFIIAGGLAGGGLALGWVLRDRSPLPHTRPDSFQPNAWLQITPDGTVIFQLDKAEMGQGVINALPALLGEELDFDPARMVIEFAGAHSRYKNPAMGVQITGGSTSVVTGWEALREAGATARAMLVAAAAAQWGVAASACTTRDGVVVHPDGQQQLSYGQLATEAARQPEPGDVPLKPAAEWKWIGRPVPRYDSPDKIRGKTVYGVDVSMPGLKVAVVVRCPQFGGKVRSFDAAPVQVLSGVRAVFGIHTGVAIVADTYWQARQAAQALAVEWDKGPLAGLDSAAILAAQKKAVVETAEPFAAQDEGDVEQALATAATTLRAEYTLPYQHHSPMEPQNCTALFKDGGMELWVPTQTAGIARAVVAYYTRLPHEQITVNSTFLGGGFGRRGYVDFVGEAAVIARQVQGVPIKLMWSREDDMQHDYYRPATYHLLQASLDAGGQATGWKHTLAGASILKGFGVELMQGMLPSWVPLEIAAGIGRGVADGIPPYDVTMAEGAKIPYAVPNRRVSVIHVDAGVPVGFWRSVSHSFNAFIVESFIDELAHAARQDPVAFRRQLLKNSPRHLAVLERVAEKAGWGAPLAAGTGRGVSVHESFGSVVGMVAEVTVTGQRFRVTRLVCAVECGTVIHPDQLVAQIEGGAIYGLSATLFNGVTIRDGACAQSNFHDLPVLRMDETPHIEVHIVTSDAPPGGVGEIAVPPVAAAVANALFAATGQRLRDLPLALPANG